MRALTVVVRVAVLTMVRSWTEELTRPLFLIAFTAVLGLLSYFYYRSITLALLNTVRAMSLYRRGI